MKNKDGMMISKICKFDNQNKHNIIMLHFSIL